MLLTVMLAVSIIFMANTMNSFKTIVTDESEMTKIITDLKNMSDYLVNEARLYSYTGDARHLDNYMAVEVETLFSTAQQRFEELAVPQEIADRLLQVDEVSLRAAEVEMQAFAEVAAGNEARAQQLLFSASYEADAAQVNVLFGEFSEALNRWSTEQAAAAERVNTIAMTLANTASLLFMLLVITMLVMINKKARPLFQLAHNAQKIATGNLRVKTMDVRTKDEIGHVTASFNSMIQSLQSVLKTVNESSTEVAASSEELLANAEQTTNFSRQVATTIQDMANGAQQQQQQMLENKAALGEVTAGIWRVAVAAEDVAAVSNEAKDRAETGKEDIAGTVQQMQAIKGAVDETQQMIHELAAHSQHIEAFVTAISDISDQTNLLALNAAIEAARAGEAGKGFAVVADEVRKLAEQSSTSAGHIAAIIHALQHKVTETSQSMVAVTTQVEEGVAVVTKTGGSFEGILSATAAVSDQMTGVAAIAQQMSASAEQMGTLFANLQIITNETTTNSKSAVSLVEKQYGAIEEITASAHLLSSLAETLNAEVSRFKL